MCLGDTFAHYSHLKGEQMKIMQRIGNTVLVEVAHAAGEYASFHVAINGGFIWGRYYTGSLEEARAKFNKRTNVEWERI